MLQGWMSADNFCWCTCPRWLDDRGMPLTGWTPAHGKMYRIAGAQVFHGEPCLVLAEMPDALWPAAGFESTIWDRHIMVRRLLDPNAAIDGQEIWIDGKVC